MISQRLWSSLSRLVLARFIADESRSMMARVRDAVRTLRNRSTAELLESLERTRDTVSREGVDSPQATVDSFALMTEALFRARGIELYDAQLAASVALARGKIAEMQTGEGKTFACAPATLLHALTGRGVHVATTNRYLAERDRELLEPAYRLLGIRAGLLPPDQATTAERRAAYLCDVTYGTGHEFGFDYLKDQLTLRALHGRPLGTNLLQQLNSDRLHREGADSPHSELIQRRLYYLIVDEADNVLLDDALSPLVLSGGGSEMAVDADVHLAALRISRELTPGVDFDISSVSGATLTAAGIETIHRRPNLPPVDRMQRTWTEYVQQALAASALRHDVHYIVDDSRSVRIVDESTGRIYSDRTWRNGLHQAVEAKEGLKITSENDALAQVTWQRFSRLYERLAGMTGTGAGSERELRQVYGLEMAVIPPRLPSRRQLWPHRFFVDRKRKWEAIASSVADVHARGRPVLVGVRSIADGEQLAELFGKQGIELQLLHGRLHAEEARVVAAAGVRGAVTIATNLAGRGTDIKLGTGVDQLGGLHVVVSECHESPRVDRQLIGRCGRQGDPGSAQVFVAADDTLIRQHGAWLATAMVRHANRDGEIEVDLTPQLRRLQKSVELAAYAGRIAMLRRDIARNSLFSNT